MQTPNRDLDFWNSDPKIHFWSNLSRKSQSYPFFPKIGVHGVSIMLILIPTLVSEFPILNPCLGKFGPKKSKLSVLPENWHTWYLEDAGSTLNPFLGKPRSKVPNHHFLLKLGTQSILKMLILIPILVFSISNLKFIFVQIWAENVKVFRFAWKLAYRLYRGYWFLLPH